MNLLLVLKSYYSTCCILKNFKYKLYLHNCKNSKFFNLNYLDISMFDYIDVVIVNDDLKKELIEQLVNSFNGNKTIYLFSNLNFKITNYNCIYFNYIKLDKIIKLLDETCLNASQTLTTTKPTNTIKREIKHTNTISNIKLPSNKRKYEFRSLCVKYIDCIREADLPTISQNNILEAVLVEYRCLPHLEFLIRNCIHKLGSEWSQTIICGNSNFEYILNIVKNINRDIKVIKTDYDNLSQLQYSDMLMTRDFWDLLVGEKILIYQEDTCIFKNNINNFLEWDYIGAPFDEINNHQNGGLSLRTRCVMIDIIENAYALDTINCDHGKFWMNIKKHDKLPEDIFFTQHMKINTKWKLAPSSTAQLFSCETKFNCDSFGMHCYWLGNGVNIWKQHFEQFLQKYTCKKDLDHIQDNNCSTYLQNSNIERVDNVESAKQISSETINKDLVGTDCAQNRCNNLEIFDNIILNDIILVDLDQILINDKNNYLNKLSEFSQLTGTSESNILLEPKNEFRYLFYRYADYFCSIDLPIIKKNNYYEAILIEYRCLPHLECLIRNCISKLGKDWSQTIVCGEENYEYILYIVKNIDRDIKVIKTDYKNVNQNVYNNMLLTTDFWNLFFGEKLLIYQEDTFIFDNNINQFIKYDYIGAPWPKDLEINEYSVGNGGLSLRSKCIMIQILNNKCNPEISKFALNYQKKSHLDKCPEDVYFTTSMIKYKIGNLASWDVAKTFSVETINETLFFGGHNFWFADNKWKNKIVNNMIDYKLLQYSGDYFIIINKNNCHPSNINIDKINIDKINLYKCILDKSLCIKYIVTNTPLDNIIFLKKTNFKFQIKFDSIINTFKSDEKLVLETNIISNYDINFTAIYFPQYHTIPENDLFWGKDFTEWTLLKPYPKKIFGDNSSEITIMKPHNDIGYYELNENYINKQIKIADDYGIDTFMVYHYWFSNCHKVMYKPLEHIIKKKFCLCWANEPWSKRWDGQNNEVLLDQKYDNFDKMIEYLYQYFRCENYIRDKNGDIVYFIYNYNHLGDKNFNKLKNSWSNYLSDKNMKIRFIFSSSFIYNNTKQFDNLDMYLFEPLENNINRFRTNEQGAKNDFNYYYVNYKNIINYYKNLDIKYLENKIQGVCLNWNNCVRRKNLQFLYVDNYNTENLKELLTIQVSNIILKESYYNSNSLIPNMLIINAWNEWNEQAILEPNDETGYNNLETIQNFKSHLQTPLITFKKENILFIDINYDNIDSGGVVYSLSVLKNLVKNYCVYFHPNFNKYTKFYKTLEEIGIKILIAKNIMNLIEWKQYNFKEIIISRALNHYYYDRLMPIFSNAKYYILTHDLVHLRDSKITKEYELAILNNYDKCFMISKYEIEYLINNNFNSDKLLYIPITLQKKILKYNSYNTSNIYFLGSCHEPNVEAMNIFYDYFLEILKQEPSIILHIYGTVCSKFNKLHNNIIKHGFVENLDENLLEHRLCISPLINGAGIKIKIMDNLNLGIPIIGTNKSIEGIELIDGETYYNLEFDNKYEYACKFLEIYKNFENLNKVSIQSKAYFDAEYSD